MDARFYVTTAESIVGLVASVFAIIGTMVICVRYLARRFDRWTETIIDNSRAVKHLTVRVAKLEETIRENT